MAINESTLPEFERDMAMTRLLLDRYSAERAAWEPYPKSMGLGELASHSADFPVWARPTIRAEPFDSAVPAGDPYPTPPFRCREEALRRIDRNVAEAPDPISGTDDAALTGPSHPSSPGAARRLPSGEGCSAAGHLQPHRRRAAKGLPTWLG
jgi:hypothetical protein